MEKKENAYPMFISKIKQNFEWESSKLSKKVNKDQINFCKIDFVALYSNNQTLKMGNCEKEDLTELHDYSEQFIVSKGTIKLKNSEKSLNSSNISEHSPSSSSSENHNPSINNICP